MSWKERRVMDERSRFITRALEPGVSVAAAAREFGVSRKTAYKWLERFEASGVAGLGDRSRAPQSCPHRTSEHVVRMLIETRRTYPTWGARKILGFLHRKHPGYVLPAASTAHDALAREGLIEPRKTRNRTPRHEDPLRHADGPNEVWSVDYKGQFQLGDSTWCYPLTITDNYSRMLLGCFGLPVIGGASARECMENVFVKYGLPRAIRSDNGAPFATKGIGGLSELSCWWQSLGVAHERIKPGRPDQNGRHERMHLTLKIETARPAAESLLAQNERFEHWQPYFNEVRPHEALGQRPPCTAYQSSPRRLEDVTAYDYGAFDFTRTIQGKGEMNFAGTEVLVGRALAHQVVGIVEVEVDVWLVSFAGRDIGLFEPGDRRVSAIDTNAWPTPRGTL